MMRLHFCGHFIKKILGFAIPRYGKRGTVHVFTTYKVAEEIN